MILTPNDFDSTIESLMEEKAPLQLSIGADMNSSGFNNIFSQIEDELDALYERTRLVEDLSNYCRSFLKKEIENEKNKLTERLRIIEQSVDSFQDTSFVAFDPKFHITDSITDRDGNDIPCMVYDNGNLLPNILLQKNGAIESISVECNELCYSSSYNNLMNHKPARCQYRVDEPVLDGITEHYTVMLKEPINCNFVSIDAVNCSIDNCTAIIDKSGITKEIELNNDFIEPLSFIGISFDLHANMPIGLSIEHEKLNNDRDILGRAPFMRNNNDTIVSSFVSKANDDNRTRYRNNFKAENADWRAHMNSAFGRGNKASKEAMI